MTTTPTEGMAPVPEPHGPAPVHDDRPHDPPPAPSRAEQSVRLGVLIGLVVLLGWSRGMGAVVIVLAIVVMIFLHELGHFVAARRAGMKATEFFIGFGPRIWSFHRGETEYGVKAIPAGAYVKIIGMNNLDRVDPADEGRTYRQKRFRDRFSVAVAGSAMHFAIALVLLFVSFTVIGMPSEDRTEIRSVSDGSVAEELGLREGDRIVAVNGESVESFLSVARSVVQAPGDRFTLTVERDGTTFEQPVEAGGRVKVVGTVREDLDLLTTGDGVRLGAFPEDGRLAAAGLEEGALVTEINGRRIRTLDDVAPAVAASEAGTLEVVTEPGSVAHTVTLGSQVATREPTGFLGVGERPVLETTGPIEGVYRAFESFGRFIGAAVVGVGRFIWPPNLLAFMADAFTAPTNGETNGAMSASEAAEATAVESEGRVMSIVGAVLFGAELTWVGMIFFFIQINIFIGVFNLIPLYPFDGGHVVVAFYEKVQELRLRRRRYVADVSRLVPVSIGVIVIFAAVALLATYRDLADPIRL